MGQVTGMPELNGVHPKSVKGCNSSPLHILFKNCDVTEDEIGQAVND